MKITVYLGSSMGKKDIYRKSVEELGRWIGSNGHTLLYGGSEVGLMGVVANAVLDAGGEVIGIEPGFFVESEFQHDGITELIVTEDIPERRTKLIEMGDAFVTMPGGVGTLDEISELVTLLTLDMADKPCVIVNIDGFYDSLIALLDKMTEEGFIAPKQREKIIFVNSVKEAVGVIQ